LIEQLEEDADSMLGHARRLFERWLDVSLSPTSD